MTVALEGGEWSFYRRLGGPQAQSGLVENLIPTGIQSQTVQPVVSRYTNWANQPTPSPSSNKNVSLLHFIHVQ